MSLASLSDLWSAAAARLARLQLVFGAPFAFLSARIELTRAERRAILRHLVPLERLVRAALLVMALCEPAAMAPTRAASRPRTAGLRAAPAWPGADSSAWSGVRFRVLPAPPRPRLAARARLAPRATAFARYPLAKRMEAVARVIAAPERIVRRLAVMLRTRTMRVAAAIGALSRPHPYAPSDVAAAGALLARAPFNTS